MTREKRGERGRFGDINVCMLGKGAGGGMSVVEMRRDT